MSGAIADLHIPHTLQVRAAANTAVFQVRRSYKFLLHLAKGETTMADPHVGNGGGLPVPLPPGVPGEEIRAASDELKSIRTAATSWTTTVSAMVGISIIIGLLKGSSSSVQTSLPTQILFALAFFLTLLAAVASIYNAASASIGEPQSNIDVNPGPYFRKIITNTQTARNQLVLSKRLAIVAVIFLFLTIFFSLFDLFASGPAGTTVLAVQRSGSVVCGKLTRAQAGQVSLTNNGQTITLNDVISLTVVPSCPK